MVYTLQFDGACRGNPGICGAGFVIFQDDKILEQHSKFISKIIQIIFQNILHYYLEYNV